MSSSIERASTGAPESVAQIVSDLVAPLVRSENLDELLRVRAAVDTAIGECERGRVQSTASRTIVGVVRTLEKRIDEMRADLDLLMAQLGVGHE